jgi:hypothetical protein
MARSQGRTDRNQMRAALNEFLSAHLALRLARTEAAASSSHLEVSEKYKQAEAAAAVAQARAEQLVSEKGSGKDKARISVLIGLRS